jgi:membrane AbrB-like protein
MGNLTLNLPLSFMLLFLLGYFGYRVFRFFNIPGGAITGSLLLVAIFSCLGVGWANIPSYFNTFFQVVLGIMVGCKFDRETAPRIKTLIVPSLFVTVTMAGISLVMGVLLAKITGIEAGTALYASMPGGLAEMSLLAMERNLNAPVVTLFQYMRVLATFVSVPLIAIRYNQGAKEAAAGPAAAPEAGEDKKSGARMSQILITLVIGGFGGFAAKAIGVPVGGLLGAMTVVGLLRTLGVTLKPLPRRLVIFAQIGLGVYLGTTFTPEVVATLHRLLIPTAIFSVVIVLLGVILGVLIHRFWGLDLVTSLLACAAAGVTQMSAIALDMDADAVTVGLLQAFRYAVTMMVMPAIISLMV